MCSSGVSGVDWQTLTVSYSPFLLITEPWALFRSMLPIEQTVGKHSKFFIRIMLWEDCDQPRQHIKNQRHYFANKGPSSQAMVFSVLLCGCESQTIKKAERERIDASELCCWRRLLRVPWTARKSNQSILKDISPRCLLEGLMLRLKLQYFGHLM